MNNIRNLQQPRHKVILLFPQFRDTYVFTYTCIQKHTHTHVQTESWTYTHTRNHKQSHTNYTSQTHTHTLRSWKCLSMSRQAPGSGPETDATSPARVNPLSQSAYTGLFQKNYGFFFAICCPRIWKKQESLRRQFFHECAHRIQQCAHTIQQSLHRIQRYWKCNFPMSHTVCR